MHAGGGPGSKRHREESVVRKQAGCSVKGEEGTCRGQHLWPPQKRIEQLRGQWKSLHQSRRRCRVAMESSGVPRAGCASSLRYTRMCMLVGRAGTQKARVHEGKVCNVLEGTLRKTGKERQVPGTQSQPPCYNFGTLCATTQCRRRPCPVLALPVQAQGTGKVPDMEAAIRQLVPHLPQAAASADRQASRPAGPHVHHVHLEGSAGRAWVKAGQVGRGEEPEAG